jgi:hypothetical protein
MSKRHYEEEPNQNEEESNKKYKESEPNNVVGLDDIGIDMNDDAEFANFLYETYGDDNNFENVFETGLSSCVDAEPISESSPRCLENPKLKNPEPSDSSIKTNIHRVPSITLYINAHADENYDDPEHWLNNNNTIRPYIEQNKIRLLSIGTKPLALTMDDLYIPKKNRKPFDRQVYDTAISIFSDNEDTGTLQNLITLKNRIKPGYRSAVLSAIRDGPRLAEGEKRTADNDEKYNKDEIRLFEHAVADYSNLCLVKTPVYNKIFQTKPDCPTQDKFLGIFLVDVRGDLLPGLKIGENFVSNNVPTKEDPTLTDYENAFTNNSNVLLKHILQHKNKEERDKCIHTLFKIALITDSISLSEILELFIFLGFDIINIIDLSCRISCTELSDGINVIERSRQLEEPENRVFPRMSKNDIKQSLGGRKKSKKTRKTRNKPKTKKSKKTMKRRIRRTMKKTT